LSLSDRIAKRYEDAFKPANLNKFLFGQAENVGQSMMAIGIQFLSGLTGLDIGSVVGPAQQIMQHFAGSGSGSDDNSSLQAGSGMDNAITGDFNSFLNGNGQATGFDPMGGLDLSQITSGIATNGAGGPGITNQDAGALQQLAQQMLMQAGFPASEWPPFKNIVDHESSWNPAAKNASGAFGLGQFLGHENDEYGQMGAYTTDPAKQLSAMIKYIRDRYGSPTQAWAHWQANNSYAAGGLTGGVPARVSRGEYRMSPKAVSHYGVGFMNGVNNGFLGGGIPFLPQGVVLPPTPAPPLPRGPQAMPMRPTPGANQNGPVAPPPVPAMPAIPVPPISIPSLGPGGAGVPAPAPAPPPPSVGAGGVQNAPPVPQGPNMVDPAMAAMQRGFGTGGAAPATNQHLAQGLSGAIKGGFDAAGQAAATAGSIAGGMGMPGAGQGGQLIQSAMQMAGQFANGLANVAASAGVGTIDQIGTQQTPSGTPLLPAIAPTQFQALQSPDALAASAPLTQGQAGGLGGGPAIVNNYFGGIHTQNMDEWQRRQQLLERQQEQPLTSAYVH
jgi:Transglycosylase SLT domain